MSLRAVRAPDSMTGVITITAPDDLTPVAARMRGALAVAAPLPSLLDRLAAWAKAIEQLPAGRVPGAAYLSRWLRRDSLERILRADFGPDLPALSVPAACAETQDDIQAVNPIGIVGHWAAGNVDLQALLSGVCGVLGGNGSLVRVPSEQARSVASLMEVLPAADPEGLLTGRLICVSPPSDERGLHEAMARHVDGAMIWGGEEAVRAVRSLPFPVWARIAVFGPRYSLAMVDAGIVGDAEQRKIWCERLARDVWLYEQRACSSPQAVIVESAPGNLGAFLAALADAFKSQNRRSPRRAFDASDALSVIKARAEWLVGSESHSALMTATPDWTILVGEGPALPQAAQNRTLVVSVVASLEDFVETLDGGTQTIGMALSDPQRELALAMRAGLRGVDRVVPIGQMHLFGSPWDGQALVRAMTRSVFYAPSRRDNKAAAGPNTR
jgi:Acyl-CoA reductase (LuxC)